MNRAQAHSQQALVAGLLRALRPALEPGADAEAPRAARDVAQVLLLPGLDAALGESLRHEGPEPPREAAHVIARIARLADAAEQAGSLAPFTEADGQLGALAETLAGMEWSQPDPAVRAAAVVPAAEVLRDWLPGSGHALERARLSPVAAGALRAALDWLLEPGARAELELHDTALALVLPEVRPEGLALAGATLSAADGALLEGDDGRWQLRVPLLVERSSFLLVRQGHLALALPWHAVARLRMLSPEARAALREQVLALLAAAAELHGERPAALLAHGLRRAWCVAERIVWRIVAEPGEPDRASPMAGLERSIEVEDGERYWVTEAAWMLRRVEPAPTPAAAWTPRTHALPALSEAPGVPAAAFEPLSAADLASPVPVAPALPTRLTAEHAVPLSAPPEPAAEDARPHEPPPLERRARTRPEPPPPVNAMPARSVAAVTHVLTHAPAEGGTPAGRASGAPTWHEAPRALVVDDSLVARLFLGRLLERRGYQVEFAASAAEASPLLALGGWQVVFADLSLPDQPAPEWLEALAGQRAAHDRPFALVALTRDRDDDAAAAAAGLGHMLRKPFESESLDALLSRLPAPAES